MNDAVPLRLDAIRHGYGAGPARVEVLKGASLTIAPGEIAGLVAPSGAGKSTLLHVAGLLERPDSGEIEIGGTACARLGDGARTAVRRARLGFVYQFHHLLPEFSARENIVLPQLIAGVSGKNARARAEELLDMMRLRPRADHRPAELSGGEQQRIAIARALANNPALVLADEPTGNLDGETAGYVLDALMESLRATGSAALIVTHNPEIAARLDRVWRLDSGQIVPAG